jgi:hypothetical protein
MKSYFGSNLKRSNYIGWLATWLFFHGDRWWIESTEKPWTRVWALVLSLRCSDLDVVSSYGIAMTRCNRFANLWWWRWSTEGWRRRRTLLEAWCRWGGIPARLQHWDPPYGSGGAQGSSYGGHLNARDGAKAARWRWVALYVAGEKFTVGHRAVPFYRLGVLSHVEDELYLIEESNSS